MLCKHAENWLPTINKMRDSAFNLLQDHLLSKPNRKWTSASRGPWKLPVVVCMGWCIGWCFARGEDLNRLEFKMGFCVCTLISRHVHWKITEILRCNPPKTPKYHPNVTKFSSNDVISIKKLFWKYYQNRMTNDWAILLTSQMYENNQKFEVRPP